jgi:hypothetical protein
MSDSLLPKLIEKVEGLHKYAVDPKNDRMSIIKQIVKTKQWLISDRSLIEHRCCQSYLTFLYSSYGDEFADREDFVDWVKYQVRYCRVKRTEAIVEGQKVVFKKFKPLSLSFAQCSQKIHNQIFQKIQEFAMAKWGCSFSDWYSEWSQNEHLMQ